VSQRRGRQVRTEQDVVLWLPPVRSTRRFRRGHRVRWLHRRQPHHGAPATRRRPAQRHAQQRSRARYREPRRIRGGLGRYVVEGTSTCRSRSSDPAPSGELEDALAGRDILVPLTEATPTIDRAARSNHEAHETLLVNRSRIEWLEAADDAAIEDEDVWASQLIGVEPAP
jgi:hypothetical protein